MSELVYKSDRVELWLGSCLDVLPQLEGIDCILADPPYGMGYKPKRSLGKCKKWQSQQPFIEVIGDSVPFDPTPWLVFPTVVLWGANHYASRLPDSGGWLCWDKKRGATLSQGFQSSDAELAWTNHGGMVRLFSHMWTGLCRDSEVGKHYHPTQKPVALMEWCMDVTGIPKDATVFDPYAGSATVAVACLRTGRKNISCEIDENYCEIAMKRIKEEESKLQLPFD